MELKTEKIQDVLIMTIQVGHLDASNSKIFKEQVSSACNGVSKLVFDMSPLQFIDSSGLGAFLYCLRNVSSRGGDLKLCGMSNNIRTIFELVRMHKIFDIYNSKEEAAMSLLR